MASRAGEDRGARAGLERRIRYCTRLVFSSERLERIGEKLRYALPKPTDEGQMVLLLKPFDLKLAQLIPPPRKHRHHYHGVLAPNSPLRAKIVALTGKEFPSKESSAPLHINREKEGINQPVNKPKKEPSKASLFRWTMLLARIFEIFSSLLSKMQPSHADHLLYRRCAYDT